MSDLLMSLEEVKSMHQHATRNRQEIESSKICGCFYCLQTFPPITIEDWCGEGETAICPKCGIDSVLGDAGVVTATEKDVLQQMHRFWFENDQTGLRKNNA